MKITFDVKNQILTRTDRNQVIANSGDYLEAEITFSNDWATLEKTMTFKNGNELYTIVLANNKILQENHLNLGVGTWKASIVGIAGDQKIVTNECNVSVNASGWIGSESIPPESVWNQLLVIIQNLHTEAASTAALRSAVQKYIEDNYDALVKEAIIVDDVRAALDDMADDGSLSNLLAPLVAAGLPDEVANQIGAVVELQIGDTVADQLPAEVTSQLPAIAATAASTEVGAWLSDHVDPDTGYVIDDTLTTALAAADAKATGDAISAVNSAVNSAIIRTMTPRASSTESGLYTIQSGSTTPEGRAADNNKRARSMYINIYNNARVKMTNSDYVIFRLWTYKQALDTGDSPQRQVVADTVNGQSEVLLSAQGSEAYFRVVFCYASDHSRVLTSTDFDAISQAFVVEKGTDTTFTKRDIAADSKAVGDNALVNRGTVASGLLEDCRTRGFYNINSTYVPTDAPSNGAGKMLVISPTDGSWTGISQIYFASDNSFWFRWNAAATKQDTFVWHRVTDCDNIINLVNEMTKYQIDTSTITYMFGGITSEGQGKRTKTRIRMLKDGKGAFKAGSGSTIEAKPGYKFSVAVYDWYWSNSDFKLRSYKAMNADPFTLAADGYIRVAIGTIGDDILWDEYETGVQYFTPAGIAAQDGLTLNITDKTVKEELAELENQNSNAFENVFLLEDEIPLNAVAFHELFDDFVADGKISRTLIGNIGNDVTLPVYLYTLRSDMKHINPNYTIIDWNGSNELYSRPKIFISSGVHGNERSTPFALYSFIADMINDVSLVDIRNAFDWYFVPLVNPWGFGHSAIIKATGNVSDGIGYTDQTISNYTVIDNTPQVHQGIRRNEAGIDANRDFDTFETEEAQLVKNALDSVYADNRKCVFAMDMHQASVGDDVNIIGSFLSLNYGASSEQKDFAYGKWMQAGAKTEKLMADYCDVEEKQSVYAWDGTNLMTLRNYLANYSELASCFEGGQNVVYYSRDTTWSNSIARAFTNTQFHVFMQKITEKWMV